MKTSIFFYPVYRRTRRTWRIRRIQNLEKIIIFAQIRRNFHIRRSKNQQIFSNLMTLKAMLIILFTYYLKQHKWIEWSKRFVIDFPFNNWVNNSEIVYKWMQVLKKVNKNCQIMGIRRIKRTLKFWPKIYFALQIRCVLYADK